MTVVISLIAWAGEGLLRARSMLWVPHTVAVTLQRIGKLKKKKMNFPCGMTNQRYHPDLGSETSSVLNLCGCSSDVILSGNQWWRSKMLAVFSGYTGQQRDRKTSGGGGYSEFQVTGIIEWSGQKSKIQKNSLGLLICNPPKIPRSQISLSSGFVFTLERGTPLWIDSTEVSVLG